MADGLPGVFRLDRIAAPTLLTAGCPNLPMPMRTSLATVEGGKEMSLPIMMASGPGVMPESAESRGSKGPKKRKPQRRRTAMLKRPLKRIAKRVKKLRPLKGKRLRRPGKKLVRKIRSLRKRKKR
jgi:hypothetical protein